MLEIWGDEKIQSELDGAKRKHPLHEKIASELHSRGYTNKSRQNLKSTYRGIKDHSNKSGNEKKTGFFYEELDAILGHRPASTPPVILDALGGGLSADPEEDREDSDESGKSVATSIGTVTAVCF